MAKEVKMAKREVVEDEREQCSAERRCIRSEYLNIKNLISDKKDDIMSVDSDKFDSIISEVETLHQFVEKPREQVADAEALLDIANTLVAAFSSEKNGVTPSDFVTALIRKFGMKTGTKSMHTGLNSVSWADIGFSVSYIFKKAPSCCTMVGPMKTEIKQRASVSRRKRLRPTESSRPELLAANEEQAKSDTDKKMVTMFEILIKKRSVRLESLVLNRSSFAQTIENIFALSFLVKDGRVEITMNDNGDHLVLPRNAPAASAVTSGLVCYRHFVFRFDYEDWKLMAECVEVGDELMPHRCNSDTVTRNSRTGEQTQGYSHVQVPTPIKKFSRNHGLVTPENSVGNGSPEPKDADGSDSSQTRKRQCLFS
ncbi:uncharacterized protein A4U43_C01F2080 [Asparagus officinalis]|uniref:Non-structural maintenance of chromosomes element 4 n=1 Tax=Asparagus officinalis TaxID=4686 RepID=A0A5P1FMQ5_ASPOF|nr:non-structural maintenance of chromosomes element 4 homolog A-like [Asparagus officinalis]ONK79023.1 uncharacterized protein A4U43_C01F2080 [Asparagus officinalis]